MTTINSAVNDLCPCLETQNIITTALPNFPGKTGRIEVPGLIGRWWQAPNSHSSHRRSWGGGGVLPSCKFALHPPYKPRSCIALLCTVCPASPCGGDHIHHCLLLWQHLISVRGIPLSTSGHQQAVKQCLENSTLLAVTFIPCVVKSSSL